MVAGNHLRQRRSHVRTPAGLELLPSVAFNGGSRRLYHVRRPESGCLHDFVSCIVLIVGATLICVVGMNEVGGWENCSCRVAWLL
jgi:hypothetical protein